MSDSADFSLALQTEDEVGRVIRTHLYIENHINSFLEIATPYPEHLSAIQLDYFARVQLALALGLPEKFKKPLNFMGKLRNKFAHKLNLKIDKSEVSNFFDTFSEDQKNDIIETASMKSLSWVSDGKAWKSINPSSRFLIMCFALYYGLKMAIIEFESEQKISGYQKRIAKIRE